MTSFPERAGLQPERTALAWQRTSITATVALIPLIVVDARLGQWWLVGLGSVGAITAAALLAGLQHRFRQLLDDGQSPSPFNPMLRVGAVTGICSIVGSVTGILLWRH